MYARATSRLECAKMDDSFLAFHSRVSAALSEVFRLSGPFRCPRRSRSGHADTFGISVSWPRPFAFQNNAAEQMKWTPKFRPLLKLDFSRSARCEKEQIDETQTQTV